MSETSNNKSSAAKKRNRSESQSDIFDVFAKSSILNATLENDKDATPEKCEDDLEECKEEDYSGSDQGDKNDTG